MAKNSSDKNNSLGPRNAFTLLEGVVAIGIIGAGLVVALILFSQSSRAIRVAESRVVATNLAQEAIEVVINIRDTNWIAGQSWLQNLPATTKGIVDYDSTAVTETLNPDNYCLSLVNDVYLHGPPPCNTPFKRHVEIIDQNETIDGQSVDFIEVRAVVEWTQNNQDRSIIVVDHLYDWK